MYLYIKLVQVGGVSTGGTNGPWGLSSIDHQLSGDTEILTLSIKVFYLGAFQLVHTQFYMISGPPLPLFACNTQWKCIGDLNAQSP